MTPDLSLRGRLDVGVALLTDHAVDALQPIGRDGRERLGAVVGEVAVRPPGPAEVRRALDQHGRRPEGLGAESPSEGRGGHGARGRGQQGVRGREGCVLMPALNVNNFPHHSACISGNYVQFEGSSVDHQPHPTLRSGGSEQSASRPRFHSHSNAQSSLPSMPLECGDELVR